LKKRVVILITIGVICAFSGGVLAGISFEDKLQQVQEIISKGDMAATIEQLEKAPKGSLVNIAKIDLPGTGLDVSTSFLAGSPAHVLALAALNLQSGNEEKAESLFTQLLNTGIASYSGYLWDENGYNNRNLQPVMGTIARYYLYRKRPDRALAFVERMLVLQQEINTTAQRENGRIDSFGPMMLSSGILYTRERDVPMEEVVEFYTFAGIVYQRNNKMAQALPMYEKSVQILLDAMLASKNTNPGRSSDFYYLMQAYQNSDRKQDAERIKPIYEAMRTKEQNFNSEIVRQEQTKQALASLEALRDSLARRYPGYLAAADEALALVEQAGATKDQTKREVMLAEAQANMLSVIIQQNCELMEQNRAILEELKKKK
jgi:hypothetical protein